MMLNKQILLVGALLLGSFASFAQRSCAAMEVLDRHKHEDPALEQRMEAIEQHTQSFIANGGLHSRAVVNIPVVVHVIYANATQNISDAQVQSQIAVLNDDFRKLNADASLIPAGFVGVSADCEVNFCLAQRTPTGAATTGINRVATTVASWGSDDKVKYTAQGGADAWDRNQYLNLWVCNLGGGLLGYAQFPGGAAATDGVVILYSAFGNTGTVNAPYNKGRTATHEVGHWLNLRHIWGDATCGSDLVSDTPTHNDANYGCPAAGHLSTCTGTPVEMTMNYMDYTDDACMYMFTAGQKARMQAVLTTGGARVSLASSLGCTAPSGGTTCAVPSTLAASGITTTTATLGWAAVAGATSYNVQYKTAAATTWTTATATTNSLSLTGLTASTTYNFQVRSVCSATSSSAYSTSASFTTSATGTTTCAAPTGVAASSITSSTFTLSWAAVTGATSYTVQYKTAAATTWTTVSTGITTTSVSYSGLAASTTYNFQVQAVCSATSSSAFSATVNVATLAATACTDSYETNETAATAKTIAVNTNITAKIGTATDIDWFKFTTTSTTGTKVKITLTNLPADYDVELYNSTGVTKLGSSANGGTTAESIIYNATASATYTVKVFGYGGATSASCYTLKAAAGTTNFVRLAQDATAEFTEITAQPTMEKQPIDVVVFPNPTNADLNIKLNQFDGTTLDATLSSVTGALIESFKITGEKSTINVAELPAGMYFITVYAADKQTITRKFIKE